MRVKYRCKKCKDAISRKTWSKSRLCRECWLRNRNKKCMTCKASLHKSSTSRRCRICYLKRYCKIRNKSLPKKTATYKNCFECNQKLKKKYVKFCSRRCLYRYKKVKRRAIKANVICHPVCRWDVYKRDSFRCYICRVRVVIGAKNTNWKQATLDHVLPLHLGGPHTEYNLKCCCRRCNSKKSKRLLSEHLLIVGMEDGLI
jgi:hypothetical protein